MHIGLFCGSLPDNEAPSGIVTYVGVMRQALMDAGHRVTVVTFSESQDGHSPPCLSAPPRSWRTKLGVRLKAALPSRGDAPGASTALAAHFAALHARDPFDIVEMEESFGWSDSVAKALPIPVVARLHGPHLFGRDAIETPAKRRRSERRIRTEGRSLARSEAITSPSSSLLCATLAHYDIDPPLARVIPNPLGLAPANACWSAADHDPKRILHVGRFDSRKGADISIAAFSLVLRKHPDAFLIIAGPDTGVSDAEGNLLFFEEYMKHHCDPLVWNSIDFVGTLSPKDLNNVRIRSAICLIPSRFESFAYSIGEAMSTGIPTVSSSTFGAVELIEDGLTGKLVPIGDIEATAAALMWMMDHPSESAAMGQRLRQRCAEWLDPGAVAQQTLELYERAIARRRRA